MRTFVSLAISGTVLLSLCCLSSHAENLRLSRGGQHSAVQASGIAVVGNDSVDGSRDGLRGTNDGLRGANDGLRGANDGLRGANDGLRGANDALRGTNNALRGANDGLRGTNDALVSMTVSLINSDRASNGAPQVVLSTKLSRLAQTYAQYLIRTGRFDHVDGFGRDPQERAQYFGLNVPISENLAWQSSNYEDPITLIRRAESDMMHEPRHQHNHRFNILNPDSQFVGVGVAVSGVKVLIVHEFAPREP